jgi:hypothetical protein
MDKIFHFKQSHSVSHTLLEQITMEYLTEKKNFLVGEASRNDFCIIDYK